MIELNLLPDIKMEFIKAQRSQRMVTGIAALVSIVAIALLIILLGFNQLQKKHITDLTKDIASKSAQLEGKPNINRILTVQSQLESLTSLHDQKPAAARLLDYLNQVTPTTVTIASLSADFTQQTATLSGTAGALSNINQYVDTLKATTYSVEGSTTTTPAFSNVVLASFGVGGSAGSTQSASYSINFSFDKTIFDTTQNVKLEVPTQTVTRTQPGSTTPGALFQSSTATSTSKGSQ